MGPAHADNTAGTGNQLPAPIFMENLSDDYEIGGRYDRGAGQRPDADAREPRP